MLKHISAFKDEITGPTIDFPDLVTPSTKINFFGKSMRPIYIHKELFYIIKLIKKSICSKLNDRILIYFYLKFSKFQRKPLFYLLEVI